MSDANNSDSQRRLTKTLSAPRISTHTAQMAAPWPHLIPDGVSDPTRNFAKLQVRARVQPKTTESRQAATDALHA
ncbi:hypothetical protein GCM10018790_00670 [Kitasatospora xanthocidica]|nr:hypothetical protein GCM10018790_00670 [Kitasatospora xanthocidica]